MNNDKTSEHTFIRKTYMTPTFCWHCDSLLTNLIRQGVRCEGCGKDYHQKCVPNIPRECVIYKNSRKGSSLGNSLISASKVEPNSEERGRSTLFQMLENENQILAINHVNEEEDSFVKTEDATEKESEHRFLRSGKPSRCFFCENTSVINSYQCEICELTCHKRCMKYIPKNCKALQSLVKSQDITEAEAKTEDKLENQTKLFEEKDFEKKTISNEITKARVIRPSLRQSKISPINKDGIFWSGYMVYYTKSIPKISTRYWKLNASKLTFHQSYKVTEPLLTINLSSIIKAILCGTQTSDDEFINGQKCYFKLYTDNNVFYGGEDPSLTKNAMNILAGQFFNMFKMAHIPFKKTSSLNQKMSVYQISAPSFEKQSLEDLYKIDPYDLLGSGQFGQVYGGKCLKTKQIVAIKAIDKSRFKLSNEKNNTNMFQNEFALLSSINHPGVVKLFALFNEEEYLYVVTEKLSIDMLNKILNSENSRLSERKTKFYIYQILIALEKLHRSHVAHCDLKPENILLVEDVDFPQVKICDFGYAKIIGENSMRRSLVGTPAYSPPEVNCVKRCYNNSMDMWSMGIIMYVSVCGEFPFDENRNIESQLDDFEEMLTRDPWDTISPSYIELLTLLLDANLSGRLSARKSTLHECFIEDKILYEDLLNLEKNVGKKWLITDEMKEAFTEATPEENSN